MNNGNVRSDTDALWGAVAIGAELGTNKRRAHYLLASGALAKAGAKVIAGRWCVSRKRLREFIEAEPVTADA